MNKPTRIRTQNAATSYHAPTHILGSCLLAAFVLIVPLLAAQDAQSEDSLGYITFCINVHDFFHVSESADILLDLIDLFESNDVRGDFYLTAPITHFYAEERPDVIARLRDSDMTIS